MRPRGRVPLSCGVSSCPVSSEGSPIQISLAPGALLHHPLLLAGAVLIVFVAFYVRAAIGFGSGLISVALLSLFFPIKETVPVVLLLDLLGSAVLGAYDFHEIRWPEFRVLVPGSFVGLVVGSFILADTNAQSLTRFLGIFILAYVIYALAFRPERLPRIGAGWGLPGVFGGVIGSLYGGGGPPLVAYLQMRRLDKRAFRATFQAIALMNNVVRVVIYAGLALLTFPLVGVALFLVPSVLLGVAVGNRLHLRIGPRAFFLATLALLAVVGVNYLL